MKHDELAWIPMRTDAVTGQSYFWIQGARGLRRDAVEHFVNHCCVEWKELRKEGWRIVRVRIEHHS